MDRFHGRERLGIGVEGSGADVRLAGIAPAGAPAPEAPAGPVSEGGARDEGGELAEICFDGKCYLMRAKKGAPLTRVNGQAVESVTLANGDVIEFGEGGPKLEFKYELVVPDEVVVPRIQRMRRRFLRWRALFLVALVAIGGYLLFDAVRTTRHEAAMRGRMDEQDRVQAERLRSQKALLDEFLGRVEKRRQEDLARMLEEESKRTRQEVERLRQGILREGEARLDERLGELSRATAARDEGRIGELDREIRGLRAELGRNAPVSRVFQKILQENDASVLLLYTEFEMVVTTPKGEERRKSGGWGSGFFLTEEGHLVTNKHVVEPWKFDPQLAALTALGLARVDESSRRIAAWPGGSEAINERREPDFTHGFNTHVLGNLSVVRLAPDRMEDRAIVLPDGTTLQGRIHRPDNNDLAILKAEGGPFRPVRVKADTGFPHVKKLDPVMVIGFPRGPGILEARVAETSPSTGVVRKVEDTIYVTASIIPGNSGGPLFTLDGEVIGVCTRVYSETLGICIRIEHALALLP